MDGGRGPQAPRRPCSRAPIGPCPEPDPARSSHGPSERGAQLGVHPSTAGIPLGGALSTRSRALESPRPWLFLPLPVAARLRCADLHAAAAPSVLMPPPLGTASPRAPQGRPFTAWLASSVSGSSSLSPGGSVTEGTHSSALAPDSRRQLRLFPCQLRDGTARLIHCAEDRPSPHSRIGPARGNLIGLIRRGHGDAGDGRDPTRRCAARPRADSARPLIGRVRNDHDICIEHR